MTRPSRQPKPKSRARKVTHDALAAVIGSRRRRKNLSEAAFRMPQHPPGVAPAGAGMAQDDGLQAPFAWAAQSAIYGAFAEGQAFLGYPELALLAQRPEYRRISETIATQMTRKWVKVMATGDEDKSEKLHLIEEEMKRLNVRDVFREAAEHDGFFGRSHIYLDLGTTKDGDELKTPIGDGSNKISEQKVGRGALKRIRCVEAVWCYPSSYNSNDPLSPDWYRPQQWFVMGKEIHVSRLLTFIGREVPDLLKPAYSFGGLSLSQMAKPYVDNWLRTRQSVSDLIQAFSVMVFKTRLPEQINNQEATNLLNRVDMFNEFRDNKGTFVVDNTDEDFGNVSVPLGTLDQLQAQAQEHIASVSAIPLIFLLGIQPTGLNASSDGEIRAFYDWIHSYQELFFRPNLHRLLGFIQLSLFGEVDPTIGFEFEPLWSLDEKGLAEVEKIKADTDALRIESGVISPDDARKRVAADADSGYQGLELTPADPPPGEEDLRAELRQREPGAAPANEAQPPEPAKAA